MEAITKSLRRQGSSWEVLIIKKGLLALRARDPLVVIQYKHRNHNTLTLSSLRRQGSTWDVLIIKKGLLALRARDPLVVIQYKHRNLNKLSLVMFFVFLRHAQTSLARSGKQKTHNICYGFPFAENEGFEPPEVWPSTVFKTAAFDHSANSPKVSH